MAEVFRAQAEGEHGFSRTVALKRMRVGLSDNPEFASMFVNEARLISQLRHPNIVQVLDFDRTSKDELFLVMELVEGCDLARLAKQGRLPTPLAVFIVGEVLSALAYAHEHRVDGKPSRLVHRDVSPQNVLLSWAGAVKLADFGIAKAVAQSGEKTRSTKGKLGYLSPEQIKGKPCDRRSDLFSLGVLLHELLTGRYLFKEPKSGNTEGVIDRILNMPVQPPSALNQEVPPELDAVCARLLERDRELRYRNAQEVLDDLLGSGVYPPNGASVLSTYMRNRFQSPKGEVAEAAMAENPRGRPFPASSVTPGESFEDDPTVSGGEPFRPYPGASQVSDASQTPVAAGNSGVQIHHEAARAAGWSTGRKIALAVLLLAVVISAGLLSAAVLMKSDVPVVGPFPELPISEQ